MVSSSVYPTVGHAAKTHGRTYGLKKRDRSKLTSTLSCFYVSVVPASTLHLHCCIDLLRLLPIPLLLSNDIMHISLSHLITLLSTLTVAPTHAHDAHEQEPLTGPFERLWYGRPLDNNIPGDGGTQVTLPSPRKTREPKLTMIGRFRLLRHHHLWSSPLCPMLA